MRYIAICLLVSLQFVFSLRCFPSLQSQRIQIKSETLLNTIPMELIGELDPKRSWSVKLIHNGMEKTVNIHEGTSLLDASEKAFNNVQSSCRNGVCTTCAAKIIDGRENVVLAVQGLELNQINSGYLCACQGFVIGSGVVIELGKYDEVYELQYGQYELSYESDKVKKVDVEKNVKRSFLGL